MTRVTVGLGVRSYDIIIAANALDQAGQTLTEYARNERLTVITDTNVARDILPRFTASLAKVNIAVDAIILPVGETTKSWEHLADLCDQLLVRGIERSDTIIALGGGVIGDLVGFAASIIKRGCHFVQIPTSLLAQVDSSVGGKTAINSKAGKNLIGAFYQPALVMIDPTVLDTLPMRERRAGYAEVLKYGLINDFAFFEWCEANGAAVLNGDRNAQIYAIETSVRAKAAIVEADERETEDKRALLNLGHTFGHALEAEHGFSDSLLHGEGVAAGMALALRYSARIGLCSGQDAERVTAHLKNVGLPYNLLSAKTGASGETLVGHMMHDKKMARGTLAFILARGIGKAFVSRDVELSDVAAFLDEELMR
jgi:3-dehydroquinate synthase